jgi:Flp pilus assembly pilin Flp
MRARRGARGASYVEVLVLSVLVAVALAPLLKLLATVVRAPTESWNRTEAALAAEDLLARIRRCRWDQNGEAGHTPTVGATLGQDFPGDFGDIDDWTGYADDWGLFHRAVVVDFVDYTFTGPAGALAAVPGPSPTKRVRVRVTGPVGVAKELTALFSNVRSDHE